MAATFDGNRRAPIEENPFLSAYGWSAITFDDDDLRGVYVLGEPQVLESHLLPDEEAPPEEKESQSPLAALRKRLPPVGRFFRRSKSAPEEEQAGTQADDVGAVNLEDARQSKQAQAQQDLSTAQGNEDAEAAAEPQTDAPKQNLFRRAVARVRKALPQRKAVAEEPESEQKDALEETALLFAYQPQIEPLYADDGLPKLPQGLIPLCTLRYAERVDPEAIEMVQGFAETGVHIKIFSSEAPDRVATILKQAGLDGSDEQPLGVISGPEMAGMDVAQLQEAAHTKTVFGHISPEQARLVVEALRERGQTVAVVGDGTKDVPAMRQANLAIARHSSSQAALSVADMVLLQDSPRVLLDVLSKGQRIVNGLLDVLKLYLTQMLYLTLLIVAIPVFARGYPYASKQGTIIAIVTVSIPSVAFPLWAATGVLPSRDLRWLLVRFVGPAAPTIGAAAFVVYLFFLNRTGDLAYAQLTVTYTLMAAGLLLVIFIKPPSRLWAGGAPVSHDRRFAAAVPILLAASFLLAWIPLAHELFLLDRLRQPTDYAIVALVVVVWAVLLRVIWWAMPFVTKSEDVGRALAKSEG